MYFGDVVQLGERLACTEEVSGSNPLISICFKIEFKLGVLGGMMKKLISFLSVLCVALFALMPSFNCFSSRYESIPETRR